MRTLPTAALLAFAILAPLTACNEDRVAAAPPPPQAITADAIGHYCGMALTEHPGPKGQVLVAGQPRPIWMSSVRDLFAFTMLPEERRDVVALYVTDVGRAADPQSPDLTAWVEAGRAWYVLDSRLSGGMGQAEPFSFASQDAARAFAAANGGTVKRFAEVTEAEILQPPDESGFESGSGSGAAMPGAPL